MAREVFQVGCGAALAFLAGLVLYLVTTAPEGPSLALTVVAPEGCYSCRPETPSGAVRCVPMPCVETVPPTHDWILLDGKPVLLRVSGSRDVELTRAPPGDPPARLCIARRCMTIADVAAMLIRTGKEQ